MADDLVNSPKHYTFGGIEVIDAIEAWQLGFHLGNVVKYVARSAHKGRLLEDLKKARWYLNRYIELLEKAGALNSAVADVKEDTPQTPLVCPDCGRQTQPVRVREGIRYTCGACCTVFRLDGTRVKARLRCNGCGERTEPLPTGDYYCVECDRVFATTQSLESRS